MSLSTLMFSTVTNFFELRSYCMYQTQSDVSLVFIKFLYKCTSSKVFVAPLAYRFVHSYTNDPYLLYNKMTGRSFSLTCFHVDDARHAYIDKYQKKKKCLRTLLKSFLLEKNSTTLCTPFVTSTSQQPW